MTERGRTAGGAGGEDARQAEIAANLAAVRARIGAACAAAGRNPAGVTLVAVTKTFGVDDVRRLVALGVADVAENRDQEARAKVAALAADPPAVPVRWHFVGRLQRNKCRSVAGYASVVHAVDRDELVDALAVGARRAARPALDVLLQVSLDADAARGGALPADVPALAGAVAVAEPLRLGGVMAVAPQHDDPDVAFARLAAVAAALRSEHPEAVAISAGMSGDLEAAIRHGATHVRIGTALLGGRAPVVG
jgi:pyridoxal phosphate enzyme (YggS family)